MTARDLKLANCFVGGGEMGALMRAKDWAATPLGPVERWPQSLRTIVSTMLASSIPMTVFWGRDYIQLYNDGYIPIFGAAKHPHGLGIPAHESWAEVWDYVGARFDDVMASGETTSSEDQLFLLDRRGLIEECYFTFSYSPLRDESGAVAGVLSTCVETTRRVIGARRLETLRALAALPSQHNEAANVAAAAVQLLEANALDFSYVALYLRDAASGRYDMVPSSLHVATAGLLPAHVDPDSGDALPFARAQCEGRLALTTGPDACIVPSPVGVWNLPVLTMTVLPLVAPGKNACRGFLAVGLSPRLAFDDAYRTFVETAAASIVAALNHADAFEQEARRALMLEELDRAKTEFFSNVSHEFRTPITLMLAPAEAMLSAPQALPEPVLEGAQVIYRNGLRLLKLVNSLLDFSRIEAGRAGGAFEPTDLAQRTTQIASMFRAAIDKAGLRLELDCPPLPDAVYVDADMWEKIVLNLLSNAFKFTLEGGIRVALAQHGGEVELCVSDSGVGISAQDLPHVFDRFYRARNTRGRSYEGSGIGLALVNELVKVHGGEVHIDSAVGRGTAVTVRLRGGHAHLPGEQVHARAREANDAHRARAFVEEALRWLPDEQAAPQPEIIDWLEPHSGSRGAHTGGHVLVADDNADLRDYLRRLLEPRYRVTLAGDGVQALEAVRRDPPDLIVSDVMMPLLDGIGLVKALRSDQTAARVPVILLSARAGEESRIEGLAAGADDYLVKPFSARELLARIDARFEVLRLQRENAQREQALLAEIGSGRQRAESILASINDAFVVFDAHWRYTYVNEAATRISRRPREELIGQVVWELYPHLVGSCFETQLRKLAQSGVPARFEYCYEPWQSWYDIRASVVPEGLSLLLTDITETKRAEQVLRHQHSMLEARVAERTVDLAQSNRMLGAEVAERRRIERELRASEERFRLAFAHASVGVAITDRVGRFLSVNRAFCEMTGYSEAELGLVDFVSLTHPEDRQRNIAEVRALVSGAKPGFVIEKRYVRNGGDIIWVRNSVSLVRDDHGQPLNLLAISEDITERKRAVDELRASEVRFRRLTTVSSDWYWEQDSEFRMVFISKGIEKVTGIPAEHVLGKRRWETGTVGLSAQEWEAHKRLLLAHQPFHDLEFAVVRPDGEARWMQISGEPVFDDQHTFSGYQGIGRDITERRRAYLRLTESEARLQAFMSNSSSMMFIKDLQGRYLHANEAFARGLGANVEAILHRIDDDLFPAEVVAQLRANDALAASGKSAIQTEETVPFVNGVRTSIVSKFPLFDADGVVVAIGGIATDITERKQVQRALEDRERLLNGVLETLPVGVWIADPAGNIIHGNPAGRRIWGGERMVGIDQFGEYKGWWSGTDRRIAAHEWALARAIERGETSLNELVDIECFDGTRKTVLNSAVPLLDEGGVIAGAIVVNEDVTARRQVEAAVASIATGVSSAVGRDFFSLLAEQLSAALGADCAFIVEVDAGHTGRTIAAFAGGRVVENFSYDVRGSPCEQVILRRTEIVANDARARFEQVPVLDRFGARHYAGTPLLDSSRNALGLMFVGGKRPFDNPELVRSALHILASRAAVELERKRNEETIRALLKVGETLYGATSLDALLDAIVTESVRLVGASGGVAGLHADADKRITRHFRDGVLRESDSLWRYEGGPAQWAVEHRRPCFIDDCLQDGRVPHAWAEESGSRCLLCVPVLDTAGSPLGFIELHGRQGRGGFAPNDLEAIVGVSRLAAIALQKEYALGQLQRAESGLLRSEQQMRSLATRLQAMLEDERTRIAREIHDEMGQALTGLKLDLAWLKTRLGKLDADLAAQFQSMFKSIDATVHSVRRIASDLRPGELDDLGLVAAIESLAQEFQSRTKTRCRAYLPEADFDIDSDLATAVFRICQELLTNIMRHARARLAEVRLERENGSLLLDVRDDGVGIRQPDIAGQHSMGLAGVRERVKMFGGTVEFRGRPGAGTVVSVRIPLRAAAMPPADGRATS